MDILELISQASREDDSSHEGNLGDLKDVWFALPAIIKSNSDGHVAVAQSAVRLAITQLDGSIKMVDFPDLDTSPVHYPGGGGVSHTHPVKKGDEGIVLLMSRAQDLWHKKGGIQDPVDARKHHLADSRWVPGGRSDPRKLSPPPSTSSQQNRSDDGNHVMDLHPNNGISHASTIKILHNVGGTNGSGTLHLVDKILKNAKRVLINCMQQDKLPPPGETFANRKKVATLPIGASGPQSSNISSIMSTLFTSGNSSLFSNPVAGTITSFTSAIATAKTAADGAFGAGNALSNMLVVGGSSLTSSISSLSSYTSLMSGVTMPSTGQLGLNDLIDHATNISQFFGSETPPTSVSLSTTLAPFNTSSLTALITQMNSIVAAAIANPITIGASGGAASINSLIITPINNSVINAQNAINALKTALPSLNLALKTASTLFSLDANEITAGTTISNPNLQTLANSLAQVFEASPSDTAAITSFPDSSTEQSGATGGF